MSNEYVNRKHVVPDLMPFICISKSCSNPYDMYKSMGAWVSHLSKDHAQDSWACLHFSHPAAVGFSSEAEFVSHALGTHGDEVAEEEVHDIARDCHVRTSVIDSLDSCPICGGADFDNKQNLLEHIAAHLLWISQISLSAYIIPDGFTMEYHSEAEKSRSGPALSRKLQHSIDRSTSSPVLPGNTTDIGREEEAEGLLADITSEEIPDAPADYALTWEDLAKEKGLVDYEPSEDDILHEMAMARGAKPETEHERSVSVRPETHDHSPPSSIGHHSQVSGPGLDPQDPHQPRQLPPNQIQMRDALLNLKHESPSASRSHKDHDVDWEVQSIQSLSLSDYQDYAEPGNSTTNLDHYTG